MFSLFLHLLVLRGLVTERGYTSYDIWFQASLWLKVLTRLKREADCYSECCLEILQLYQQQQQFIKVFPFTYMVLPILLKK